MYKCVFAIRRCRQTGQGIDYRTNARWVVNTVHMIKVHTCIYKYLLYLHSICIEPKWSFTLNQIGFMSNFGSLSSVCGLNFSLNQMMGRAVVYTVGVVSFVF